MKILHLYSDWKWTGPAEPVVQMCAALRDRGHEVLLAHSPDAHANRESVGGKARDLGVPATTEFALNRYLRPLPTLRDMLRLPAFLRRERFDIVHMHLNHDHVEGALCAKLLGRRAPVLVRTLHSREVLPANLGYRFQLRRLTDGWLTFTEKFRAEYARRFHLPEECTGLQPMSVDVERFRPDRQWKNLRAEFGVTPETPAHRHCRALPEIPAHGPVHGRGQTAPGQAAGGALCHHRPLQPDAADGCRTRRGARHP